MNYTSSIKWTLVQNGKIYENNYIINTLKAVKGNYEYRRVRYKGKESVEKELLFMALGFNIRKYQSRRANNRLQKHYLEKEETHTAAC